MPSQQLPATSALRQPRGLVRVNGQVVPGWDNWEVDNNTFYEADTFRVCFAASALPDAFAEDWWAVQTEVFLEVFAGFPADPQNFTAADLQLQIYGRVDHMEYDPVTSEVIVSGRDFTGYFIDTKTTEEWRNQTASGIATALAGRHGLTPMVTATTKKVGGYYDNDHVLVTNQHSEWDLLNYLASKEKFVVYVKGNELHFEPRPDPATAVPYMLQWQAPTPDQPVPQLNAMHLRFTHDLTVAKGVVVWVQFKNLKTKKWGSVSYPTNKTKGTKPGQSAPHTQVYTFRLGEGDEMTPDAALQLAQARHREITQHEVKLRALMPADNVLSTTNVIQVRGTRTAFDQTYYPDAITRHMSMTDGYRMDVSAKNSVPANQGGVL